MDERIGFAFSDEGSTALSEDLAQGLLRFRVIVFNVAKVSVAMVRVNKLVFLLYVDLEH